MMLRAKEVFSLLAFSAALVAIVPEQAFAQSLQPMSEEEMGGVTAQEGILVSLDFYYNSQKTNNPATDGQRIPGFCSTPDGDASLGNMNCRLAIQIANHKDHWVVVKNGHSSLTVNRLSLDAAFLGDAGSADHTEYFNEKKFRDPSNNCLLELNSCTTATIMQMPAMRTHYPETAGSYNPATRTVTGFNDARFGLFIEGIAVEFNSTPIVQDAWQVSAPNDNGSFLGLNIADNNGHRAGIAFGGDFYLYGF